MKTKLLILTILFLPSLAFATSGACSGHGGVSCASGPDNDGSVICVDGWQNSSVQYSSMVKCASYAPTPKVAEPIVEPVKATPPKEEVKIVKPKVTAPVVKQKVVEPVKVAEPVIVNEVKKTVEAPIVVPTVPAPKVSFWSRMFGFLFSN